jgi:hypothetical protein
MAVRRPQLLEDIRWVLEGRHGVADEGVWSATQLPTVLHISIITLEAEPVQCTCVLNRHSRVANCGVEICHVQRLLVTTQLFGNWHTSPL